MINNLEVDRGQLRHGEKISRRSRIYKLMSTLTVVNCQCQSLNSFQEVTA